MNIKLMKYLDELFGPSICLVLHVYNGIKTIFTGKPDLLPINKILLIKFFGLGSIIAMGPMIRALKTKYPTAKITILTFVANKEICELTGFFDEIVIIHTFSLKQIFGEAAKKIVYLRKQRFDVCIDLEFFSKFSTIICYLTGSRIRVGFFLIQIGFLLKMMWRGNLLTHQVYYNQHKHATEAFLALARSIGADAAETAYSQLQVPAAAVVSVKSMLKEYLNDTEKLVTVNINASPLCLERRWPKDNFAKLLADLLSGTKDVKIALVGGKEDTEYVDSFIRTLSSGTDRERIVDLAGKLSVAELAALLTRSQLFITNDSGPLHIAIALKKPTVSFFGPETPRRFGPQEEAHLVFYNDGIYCSPCLNVYNQKTAFCNGNNICLKSISPEQVYSSLKEKYPQLFNGK